MCIRDRTLDTCWTWHICSCLTLLSILLWLLLWGHYYFQLLYCWYCTATDLHITTPPENSKSRQWSSKITALPCRCSHVSRGVQRVRVAPRPQRPPVHCEAERHWQPRKHQHDMDVELPCSWACLFISSGVSSGVCVCSMMQWQVVIQWRLTYE